MARGVNKVILLGNLGKDPETRDAGGSQVCSFTLATSESWTDKNTNQRKEKTEWHRCIAWGKLAEICGQYLHKGSKVYVEGKISTRKYEKDGIERYVTEIVVNDMQMLDAREQQQDQGGYYEPQQPQQQQPQQQQPQRQPPPRQAPPQQQQPQQQRQRPPATQQASQRYVQPQQQHQQQYQPQDQGPNAYTGGPIEDDIPF